MCKSKLQLAQIVEQMRKVMGFLCLVSCWGGATCPTTVIREQLSDLVLLVGTIQVQALPHTLLGTQQRLKQLLSAFLVDVWVMKSQSCFELGLWEGQEQQTALEEKRKILVINFKA